MLALPPWMEVVHRWTRDVRYKEMSADFVAFRGSCLES